VTPTSWIAADGYYKSVGDALILHVRQVDWSQKLLKVLLTNVHAAVVCNCCRWLLQER
jgi:hypothetical protein